MADLSQMPTDAEVRDRAARLYKFVRGFIELRHTPISSYKSYELNVTLDDLPPPPDCLLILRHDFKEDAEDADTFLKVRRPNNIESHPEPPDTLRDWVDPDQLSDPTRDCPLLLSGSSIDYRQEDDDDEESSTPTVP